MWGALVPALPGNHDTDRETQALVVAQVLSLWFISSWDRRRPSASGPGPAWLTVSSNTLAEVVKGSHPSLPDIRLPQLVPTVLAR